MSRAANDGAHRETLARGDLAGLGDGALVAARALSGCIAMDELLLSVTSDAHSRSARLGLGASWNSTRSPMAGICSAPATWACR